MCGRYAVGNCISNYKKSFQHYVEYYEGCTIEEADETDEDEEIENQTENVELEMIDMRSLLAIRIYYAAKYGLKSVKKSSDYVRLSIKKFPLALSILGDLLKHKRVIDISPNLQAYFNKRRYFPILMSTFARNIQWRQSGLKSSVARTK